MRGHKTTQADMDIVTDDYIDCICYLYRGEKVPLVKSFKDEVYFWLDTEVGLLELTAIPHDEEYLTERRMEIEALIADNGFSDEEIIKQLNAKLKDTW